MRQTMNTLAFLFAPLARVLLVCVLIVATAATSQAVVVGNYSILIGESARYLKAVYDYNQGDITAQQLDQVKSEESCKNPSIRLFDRNQPAILVQNTSAQDNEISSVVIELEQAGYVFGLGDAPREFGGEVFLRSNQTTASVGITGSYDSSTNSLKIDFTGLGTEEVAIFRIDLDPDPNYSPMVTELYPDYRSVLLGADPGTGPTDPALISAVFSMAGMPDAETEPTPLDGPATINNAGELEVYHAQTMTDMFGQDGGIPEPTTVSLLGIASLGCIAGRRRRQ